MVVFESFWTDPNIYFEESFGAQRWVLGLIARRWAFDMLPKAHLLAASPPVPAVPHTHANSATVMTSLDLLGFIASACTTASFVPQVWRTWRTRDVSGISLPTYLIITFGLALWLIYGWFRGDLPLIVEIGRAHV